MLIQYLFEHPEVHHRPDEDETGSEAISRLNALYRAARTKFDGDPDFADRARLRVVDLQAGDAQTLERARATVQEKSPDLDSPGTPYV